MWSDFIQWGYKENDDLKKSVNENWNQLLQMKLMLVSCVTVYNG